jgi:putative transposase
MTKRITPKSKQTTHITIRCNNKNFLFNLKDNFSSMVSWLNTLPYFFSVSIHHVLFMSNHIHMLVTPEKNNIGEAMSYVLTNLSKYLNYKNKMVNHVFGNRYIPTIIADERHLINVIRYIYQNPVRAGIVDNINNYPYSCLGQYLGIENIGLKIIPDSYTRSMFQYGIDGYMEWLSHINANLNIVDTGNVKQSLSRSIYRYSRRQRDTIFKNETSIVI